MVKLEEHPTVRRYNQKLRIGAKPSSPSKLDADWLRTLCLKSGADDVGFVEIDCPEVDGDRKDMKCFPA